MYFLLNELREYKNTHGSHCKLDDRETVRSIQSACRTRVFFFQDHQSGSAAHVSFCPVGAEVSYRNSGDRMLKPRVKMRGDMHSLTYIYTSSRRGTNEGLNSERETNRRVTREGSESRR